VCELESAFLFPLEEHRAEDIGGQSRCLHSYLVIVLGWGFTKSAVITFLIDLLGRGELLDGS
jgi:hypothetical protein